MNDAPPFDAVGAILTVASPVLAPDVLAQAVQAQWGLTGTLTPLSAERDLNHRLTAATASYVVKLANPAEPAEMTAFQTGALAHVAARAPGLPVPRPVPTLDGAPWVERPEGRLRLVTWLDGTPLHAVPRSDAQRRAIGAALADLTAALQDYSHPAADHVLLWDIKQVPRLAGLLPAMQDTRLRAFSTDFVQDFTTRIAPQLARLPAQVCHADFNPHNLLVAPNDPDRLSGILDFGDMVRTPRICDLATAASYQVDPARPLDSLCAFVGAYAARLPLSQAELALLYDLILARMVTTLAIAGWRAARYPQNAAYILRNVPSASAGLDALRAAGPQAATAAFAQAAGKE